MNYILRNGLESIFLYIINSFVFMILGFIIAFFYLESIRPDIHDVNACYGNSNDIDEALQKFHLNTGKYPIELIDLVASNEQGLKTKVKTGTYHGPYLLTKYGIGINGCGIPYCTLVKHKQLFERIEYNWTYDSSTGLVEPAWENCKN